MINWPWGLPTPALPMKTPAIKKHYGPAVPLKQISDCTDCNHLPIQKCF